ncbi:hypothetical protein [Cryobacterium sp. Y62]|uniref:hypothetical protein n=1 Tax=Cryobacterium sp. Y62 TaxID=2048284 RepID=UPI000CE431BA|nr:hypothetical protein [Cryobacterium sp. Y62]
MSTFEELELEAAVAGTAYRAARARADEASHALLRAQCRQELRMEHGATRDGWDIHIQCLRERGHEGEHVNLLLPEGASAVRA